MLHFRVLHSGTVNLKMLSLKTVIFILQDKILHCQFAIPKLKICAKEILGWLFLIIFQLILHCQFAISQSEKNKGAHILLDIWPFLEEFNLINHSIFRKAYLGLLKLWVCWLILIIS